ncbi:hypothetical protein DYB30_000181 [Aphanomyces astaci]|uniref:Uncharacterized protein n=2 Tax=Aphanomyces astaci TaxID=112090 RepID=A0A397DHX2_APHAT|nr:hypothetical protein DYB30_000181 [Aphanomyces astaci]
MAACPSKFSHGPPSRRPPRSIRPIPRSTVQRKLMPSPASFAVATIFATMVAGHGIMSVPKAEFDPTVMRTTYVATIQANFPGKFNDSPDKNVAAFNKAFRDQQATGFKTLRAMLDPQGPDCGYSKLDVPAKPIPSDGNVVWQNPDSGEGFVPSHTIWLDNTRVFQNDDCATNFPEKPAAHLPVDFASCVGSCTIRFYWIALHQDLWQVYSTSSLQLCRSTNANDAME